MSANQLPRSDMFLPYMPDVARCELSLRELKSGGMLLTARRMPAGYRLAY